MAYLVSRVVSNGKNKCLKSFKIFNLFFMRIEAYCVFPKTHKWQRGNKKQKARNKHRKTKENNYTKSESNFYFKKKCGVKRNNGKVNVH